MVIEELLRGEFTDEWLEANKQEIIGFLVDGQTFFETIRGRRRPYGSTPLDGDIGLLRQVMASYVRLAREPNMIRTTSFYYVSEKKQPDNGGLAMSINSYPGEFK